jgi:hypothetical protein
MANISQLSKPPRKGQPPKLTDTMDNLEKPAEDRKVPLQVLVAFRTSVDFKSYAASQRSTGSALFEKVWRYFKEHHG